MKRGDRISEYVLEEPLGKGAFGEVWRARHHIWNDRQVAVKIPTSTDAIDQLSNEGVIQAALDHPGIAKSLGMDTTGDPPYFITEYVEGQNLRQALEARGTFGPEEALQILTKILDVLEYAHSRGVIHQDIKPSNILLSPDHDDVKLTDFGLGHTTKGESLLLSASLRSEAPTFGGTVPYIAPEIRDGSSTIDARADLYSLGIVIFEILTGKRPAGGELPSDLRSDLPAWCDRVFRGLYTRREKRFTSVAEVRQALQSQNEESSGPESKAATSSVAGGKGPLVVPISPPQRNLLTVHQACKRLKIGSAELMTYVQRGFLTQVHVDGKIYYYRDQVDEFVRKHPTHGTRPTRILSHPIPVQGGDGLQPAGFWIRVVAMMLDGIALMVLATVGLPLFAFFGLFFYMGSIPLILLAVLFYFSLTTGNYGRTFGKMCMGIRVVRQDGGALTSFDGFVRTINYLASALPLFLGFIAVPFSQRRLGFHDLMCGTRVVYDNPGREPFEVR